MTASLVTAALLPAALLVVGAAIVAVRASLDARLAGAPVAAALLSPLAEAARLVRQQRRRIDGADRILWRLAGGGVLVAAVLQAALVPLGDVIPADLAVGVVWFNAVDVLLWAFWWLLGWGADSALALVGGHRFLAQVLSTELPLMFALTGPAIAAGSLRLADIEAAQRPVWFALEQPVCFAVFLAAVLAFAAWGPFSPAAGRDIAGGVVAELSGVDRLLVEAGRAALLVAGAAVATTLFLGGGAGPLLPAGVWVVVKTLVVATGLVVVARMLPALRPQRLAEVSWLVVLPLVLVQLVVVSVLAAAGAS